MGFLSDLTSIINDTKAIGNDLQLLKQDVVTSVTHTVSQTKDVTTDISQQLTETVDSVTGQSSDTTKNVQ